MGRSRRCRGMGGKLADILDRGVPGETVVEVGHDADIDADGARFFDQADDQFFLRGNGEEDFVDEERAGEGQAVAHVSDNVGVAGFGLVFGERDKALETEAEVAERFEMIAQGVGDPAGPDDEDVAGFQAFAIAAVDHLAPDRTPDTEQHRGEDDQQHHHFARDAFGPAKIEGAAEQEAGGEGCLHGHALLVKAIAAEDGSVEPIGARQDDQQQAEPRDIDKDDALGVQIEVERGGVQVSGSADAETQRNRAGDGNGKKVEGGPDEAGDGGPVEDTEAHRRRLPGHRSAAAGNDDLFEIIRCRHGERLSHSDDGHAARRKGKCRVVPASYIEQPHRPCEHGEVVRVDLYEGNPRI